ncbi:Putative protein of unknown function [Podospora comata]|uniref:Uncharacterized protein n=1 Tax=Podospora comata TaxID=48703 RepID=A0ABY6RUL9_PODCO|nr:Putative protein of unknown function [Podospora comata]
MWPQMWRTRERRHIACLRDWLGRLAKYDWSQMEWGTTYSGQCRSRKSISD